MNTQEPEKKDIDQIFREGTAIEEALERAYRKAVPPVATNKTASPWCSGKTEKSSKFPPINSPIFPSTDENFSTVTHRTISVACASKSR